MQKPNLEIIDPVWKSLYRVAGAGALIALGFYLSQIFILIFGEPYPTTTEEWFKLFSRSKLLGLFYLNALDMASITLFSLMFLALYVALRRVSQSAMAIAGLLASIGTAVFITSRSVTFSMIPLSERYTSASSDAQRAQILLVGDAVGAQLIATPRTTGFLLISVVMLRTQLFNNAAAYIGIMASTLIFALNLSVVFAPAISDPLMGIGMLIWILWLVLVSVRLLQIGRVPPS